MGASYVAMLAKVATSTLFNSLESQRPAALCNGCSTSISSRFLWGHASARYKFGSQRGGIGFLDDVQFTKIGPP
jgi:hypothetical protein